MRCRQRERAFANLGSPTWARTRDLRINSPALYRLSYRGSTKAENEILWGLAESVNTLSPSF
ncbi:hypothetical protein PSP6_180022 [Paraburkholderia tropica]|nr:hypothetical protein PSP6_180022 [Paraburkholderia tropica]